MEQRSPEWFAARCGKVTASRIADVVARTKTGWGSGRKNYQAELVVERLTGKPVSQFTNEAMQWGIDTEPFARAAYEAARKVTVAEVGFIDHPTIPMSGASPDGHVADRIGIEIKCPNSATHIDTVLTQKIAEKYIYQMQWQMACNGRDWVDFISFDPRMPENLRLYVQRVPRDQKLITTLEDHVRAFLLEADAIVDALTGINGSPALRSALQESAKEIQTC